jgi:predicted MFS family arabinose efflux permease
VNPGVPEARRWLAPLPLLAAIAFLVQVDVRMMTPLLPTIAHSLGTSVTAMGLAMMLYMLPYGLCQFFYGPVGDRLGAIRVVRAAAIGFAVGTLLTGQAHHIVVLDAARFVTGVFAAAVVPLTFAYIGATVPYAERQGTLGRFAAVTSLAQSLSAAIGGTVAHFVSWRFLYVGVGCLLLVPAALLFRTDTRHAPPDVAGGGLHYGLVLRRRAARILYGIVGFEGLFLWGGFTYLGAIAVARFGLNELEVGLLLACYGVATLVGGVSLVRIRTHLPERYLAAFGGGLKGGAYLLMSASGSLLVFAAAIVMLGFGYIALHTTLQTRATELAPEARGTAVALFAFFLFLGGALGSAIFGPLVDHGWHRLFLVICGLGLLVLGGLAVLLLGASPETA